MASFCGSVNREHLSEGSCVFRSVRRLTVLLERETVAYTQLRMFQSICTDFALMMDSHICEDFDANNAILRRTFPNLSSAKLRAVFSGTPCNT